MKKIFNVTASVLIATFLYGCGEKEIKVSSDAVSASTQSSNAQNKDQKVVFENGPDAASSATLPPKTIKSITVEKVNDGGHYLIAKPVNVLKDDWLTNFAGGRKNTITIRVGQVINSNNIEDAEEYVELECKGSKITLIANGASYEYQDDTHKIKRKTINFLTGKKLVGKEVVKDYSAEKDKVILIVDYNENGDAIPRILFCPKNNDKDNPKNNYYELKVSD